MKIIQVTSELRIKNSDRLNWTVEGLKIAPDLLKSGEPNPKAGEEAWKAIIGAIVKMTNDVHEKTE